jgi:hypothetical protein
MSGDRVDDPQDPRDATPEAPASEAPAPDVPAAAAEADVPAYEVPSAASVDVPDAEAAAADFDVPPPPAFDSAPPSAPWSSSSDSKKVPTPESIAAKVEAATRATMRRAAEADAERPPVAPADSATDNSYRGWTFAIFFGLAVLLIAAVVGIFYLVNTAPLPFLSSGVAGIDSVLALGAWR